MREIKFRGKRLDNGEWVFGYYVKYEHMGVIKHYIVTSWAQIYVNSHQVIPETVGQFTDRCDKNGKEICEGDILSNGNGKKSVMEWCKNLAAFECEPGDSIIFAPFNWDKCEIIGTIHDQKAEVEHD